MALDGVIMTKLDGTSKGGAILSVLYELKLPILSTHRFVQRSFLLDAKRENGRQISHKNTMSDTFQSF
ncbi:hypothetical protein NP05121_08370 [Helicobacter pylori]